MGKYNDKVHAVISNYFATARSIFTQTETLPLDDSSKYNLRVFYCIRSTTLEQVQNAIDRAEQTGAALIFVFHRVNDAMSEPEDVSTTNFKLFIDAIAKSSIQNTTIESIASLV